MASTWNRSASKVPYISAISVVLAALAPHTSASAADTAYNHPPCPLNHSQLRTVVRILDAKTIALDDGTTVRLIGILPPSVPAHQQPETDWPPQEQARTSLKDLVLNKTVSIAYVRQSQDTAPAHRYGHILAHVFVNSTPAKSPQENENSTARLHSQQDPNRGLWVQAELLRTGSARAFARDPVSACMQELLWHEKYARDHRVGLWSLPAFAIRNARHTKILKRLADTYQIVDGRIQRVAKSGSQIFLNFGRNWRYDFTAGIDTSHLSGDKSWLKNIDHFEGRRVRIRGWIEIRNGPFLTITHPLQIETLGTYRQPNDYPSSRETR